MFLADTLLSKLIEAIWKRPELSRLREPIEAALRGDEFKQLTRDAFQTYADRTQQQLPAILRRGVCDARPRPGCV